MSKSGYFLSADSLLAAIVDSSDDAIVSKNLKSIVTSWNRGAERVFGYTAEEMIGQSIDRLFPADRREEEKEIISKIQRGEPVEHFETVRLHKSGKSIDVSLTISPIRNAEGYIVGASKIARDITEQRDAVRRLAAALEELKRGERLKVEFLATLSHELRTPLNAILGWCGILKSEPTAEEVDEGVAVIERNVRVQSQLIDDLLDMSRIESGKLVLDMQPVSLIEVVEAAIETVRSAATAKGIALQWRAQDTACAAIADRNRLQQVVWNLLSNAVKFTPIGGLVEISLVKVDLHVEVHVRDNGPGIAEEFLEYVFDRFRQADASTTRKHGGLGLGLSIVKTLVELHGGTVHVRSEGLGKGAEFIVRLPSSTGAHGTPSTPELRIDPQSRDELKDLRVLVVDDERDSAGMVKRMLEKRGADVRAAHSMKEGLAVFLEFLPHIVLSDIGMPEHDGYEFIACLRELPEALSVPVVALTALAHQDDRSRALRAGFQLHVAKPVDVEELVSVVQNLGALRRHRF